MGIGQGTMNRHFRLRPQLHRIFSLFYAKTLESNSPVDPYYGCAWNTMPSPTRTMALAWQPFTQALMFKVPGRCQHRRELARHPGFRAALRINQQIPVLFSPP